MTTLSPADIAAITMKCQADGVVATAIPDVLEHAERGDFVVASLDTWLKEQKQPGKRPHYWPMAGQVDLEAEAFGVNGKANFTSRSRLVKSIGIEAADAQTREYGLDGIHDYKTSPIYFHSLAPLSGFLGYEFGRWLGTIGYKPVFLAILALLVVPIALFAYDAILHVGNPGILNNLGVFISFAAAIFAFATALGIIGHKIEDFAGK